MRNWEWKIKKQLPIHDSQLKNVQYKTNISTTAETSGRTVGDLVEANAGDSES